MDCMREWHSQHVLGRVELVDKDDRSGGSGQPTDDGPEDGRALVPSTRPPSVVVGSQSNYRPGKRKVIQDAADALVPDLLAPCIVGSA
jgi:hypothetical protein